jgi:hypothetical protein
MLNPGTIGYAPRWPFRVKWNGDEWVDHMGPITSLIFEYIVSPFWDGTIKVKKEDN